MPRHRSTDPVNTRLMPPEYRPRHCAGTTCMHDHPGEPRTGRWRNFLPAKPLQVAR